MLGVDYLLIINMVLAIVIAAAAFLVHRERDDPLLLYVGIAFLIFGISNLLQIMGFSYSEILIIFQLCGFILIIYGIYLKHKRIQ
jgi:hypothetical protein